MNKYEMRTDRKKAAIINSALALFKQKGFTAVSIKEIAAMAKVSQVSIYNYFGSKEALVAECVTVFMQGILQKAGELLNQDLDFKSKLLAALSLCNNDIGTALSDFFSKEALEDSAMFSLVIENINKEKAKIYYDYIELGKQEGYIDASIETQIILCFIEALNYMGSKQEFDASIPEKQLQIVKLFLYGIIGKDDNE